MAKKGRAIADVSGRRFGRLVVVGFDGVKNGRGHWSCRCDCGGQIVTSSNRLKNGSVRSCGCLYVESRTRHGLYRVRPGRHRWPEFSCWSSIIARCRLVNDTHYHLYGGRGIDICDRWMDFDAFVSDMGRRPSKKHTVDRLDNSRGYEPGNCRWATHSQQQNNRRDNIVLTYGGETMTVHQWASRLGVTAHTLASRVRYGWSDERVLTEPIRKTNRVYKKRVT